MAYPDYCQVFIDKSKKVHDDFYDYSKTKESWGDYSPKKPIVVCPEHGEFRQRASKHSTGSKCPICVKEGNVYTCEKALGVANAKHNNFYDYTLVEEQWEGYAKKYIIVCPEHGKFEQLFHAHANGQGCPKCSKERVITKITLSTHHVQSTLKSMFPNIVFPYIEEEYKTAKTKLTGVCTVHGEFQKTFNMLTKNKTGCPKCSRSEGRRDSETTVLQRCQEVHGNKYTYPNLKGEYVHCQQPVTIICPEHGAFKQRILNHTNMKQGCPKCAAGMQKSKGEAELCDWLMQYTTVEDNRRDLLKNSKQELDMFLPKFNVAIEYNGIYWHSDSNDTPDNYHLNKLELAELSNIRLLQFWDYEWMHKREVVQSIILGAIGKFKHKIGARKLKVTHVEAKQARQFCGANHIQGFRGGKVYIGLTNEEELLSLLIISSAGEIIRFVNKVYYAIPGAFSRLLSKVEKPLFSFVDKRLFTGHSYQACGFTYLYDTKPNYHYSLRGDTLESRVKYQKHKLVDKLKVYDPAITEVQNMHKNGYCRVFDCGNKKYQLG